MGEFKIGDVVRLKSGGPAMTVLGETRDINRQLTGKLMCTWFESSGKPIEHLFAPESIEKVEALTPRPPLVG